jgi:hypothetical protein
MVISLRLPDNLGTNIKTLAESEHRSMNSLIVTLLWQALEPEAFKAPQIQRKDVPGRITNPEIVERAVDAGLRSGHDTKTCRIYGCLMCKALKA